MRKLLRSCMAGLLAAASATTAAEGPRSALVALPPIAEAISQGYCDRVAGVVRDIAARAPVAAAEVGVTSDGSSPARGDLLSMASRGPRLAALMDEQFCAFRLQATFAVDRDIWRLGAREVARQAGVDFSRRCARAPGEPACAEDAGRARAVREALLRYLAEHEDAFERHRQDALACIGRTEDQVAAIVPGAVPPNAVPTVRTLRLELWRLPEQLGRLEQGVCEAAVEERLRLGDLSARF